MGAMNLTTGWIELNSSLKTMRLRWEEIKNDWNDPVSREFEEKDWAPIEAQVEAALRAIDRLSPLLAKAKQECS
jgi:hypothetical protein